MVFVCLDVILGRVIFVFSVVMFGKIFWINIHTTGDCLTCSHYTSKKWYTRTLRFIGPRCPLILNASFVCLFVCFFYQNCHICGNCKTEEDNSPPRNLEMVSWDFIVCDLHQKYLQCLSAKTGTSTIADDNDSPWTSTTDHTGWACHHPCPPASCAWSPAENPVRWLSPWKILEYICPPPIFVLSI